MSFSLVEMWHAMGLLARLVVIALALMSAGSLAVIVERVVTFRRARLRSTAYVLRLRELLRDMKIREAGDAARAITGSPVARVVGAGIDEYLRATGAAAQPAGKERDFDVVDAVNRSLERHKEREVAELRRGLGNLATIGSTAPFVGLFGTVVGIINAFRSMAESGSGGLGAVSGGIAEALVTTAFGLLVAIPAVWMFNVLSTRVESFVVDLNDVSSEVVDFILRSGH
ncbi:MAG: MotA/TolQ/ExbB proton channel family protein [Myxococcota bacterium]